MVINSSDTLFCTNFAASKIVDELLTSPSDMVILKIFSISFMMSTNLDESTPESINVYLSFNIETSKSVFENMISFILSAIS